MRRAAVVLLALVLLLPVALAHHGRVGYAPWKQDYQQREGDQFASSSGHIEYPNPGHAAIDGIGWLDYRFTVGAPGGVGIDALAIRLSMDNWNWGEWLCQARLYGPSWNLVTETGYTWCYKDQWTLFADDVPAGTYTVRISCHDPHCYHVVYRVNAMANWDTPYVHNGPEHSSHSVTGGRLPLQAPGVCFTVTARGSSVHDTVVQADWGDGTPVESRAYDDSWANGKEWCHTFLPSILRHQVCFRVVERNGWERVTNPDCRDVQGTRVPL